MVKDFNSRKCKIKGDLLQTHYSLTWQLLEVEKFEGAIHEPCAGYNAIVNACKMKIKNKITFSDLYYGEHAGINFLLDKTEKFENIITNPPYLRDRVDDIVMKTRNRVINKSAMLLRINYLSGTARLRKSVYDGLSRIYVFTRMPNFNFPLRNDGKYPTAMIVFAWMIWDKKANNAYPEIKHIDNSKYVLRKGE